MARPVAAKPLIIGKRQSVDLVRQIPANGRKAPVDLVPDLL